MNIFFNLDGVLLDTEKPALNLWKQYIPEHKVLSLQEKCLDVSQNVDKVLKNITGKILSTFEYQD